MAGNVIRAEKIKYGRSNSSALCYSASEIALYAILRVVQAPKCDFGAFCVHQTWQWSRRLNCYIFSGMIWPVHCKYIKMACLCIQWFCEKAYVNLS